MAIDFSSWFVFKSKAEREKDEKAYMSRAFPYGAIQQKIVKELLHQLVPKEDAAMAMVAFLIGKEAYRDQNMNDQENASSLINAAKKIQASQLRFKGKDLPLYLALISADAAIDEHLLYPSADELRASAALLEQNIIP